MDLDSSTFDRTIVKSHTRLAYILVSDGLFVCTPSIPSLSALFSCRRCGFSYLLDFAERHAIPYSHTARAKRSLSLSTRLSRVGIDNKVRFVQVRLFLSLLTSPRPLVFCLVLRFWNRGWTPRLKKYHTRRIHTELETYHVLLPRGWYHGSYEAYYPSNGRRKHVQCTYMEGKLEGKYERWHQNGKKALECMYKEGKVVGEYRLWNEAGTLVSHYKDYETEHKESWEQPERQRAPTQTPLPPPEPFSCVQREGWLSRVRRCTTR